MLFVFAAILGADDAPPADEREVQRLVHRARVGDREASRLLFRLHAGRVYRAVRPLCANEADAEDTVQETFARALPRLDEYRYRPGTRFVAWLCTIAFNHARKRARSVATWRGESFLEVEPPPLPDELLDRARRRHLLLAALAELPARDREVLSLRYGAGLSAPEVAETLSLSPANVRKICERQRAWLMERLGTDASPPEQEAGTR